MHDLRVLAILHTRPALSLEHEVNVNLNSSDVMPTLCHVVHVQAQRAPTSQLLPTRRSCFV